MYTKMKKFIIIISLSFLGISASGQHEFSVHGCGGLSTLGYNPAAGNQHNGFGGHFGLGYGYFFTPKWSLLTGAEFALYNSKFKLPDLSTESPAHDNYHGIDFNFRSTVKDYEEKQRGGFLQIPLMARYTSGIFYVAGGGKIGFPLSGKTSGKTGSIKNEGEYPNEPPSYAEEELWFRGFGTFPNKDYPNRNYDNSLDFNIAFLLSLETGFKFALTEKMSLYTGAYLDYGLNSIYKSSSASEAFVAYRNPSGDDSRNAGFDLNSVFCSQYAQDGASHKFTDKVSPMAVGIKLRLAFGGSKSAPQFENTQLQKQQPTDDDEAARRAAEAEAEAARRAAEEQAQREEAERLAREAARRSAIETIQQPVSNHLISQIAPEERQRNEMDKKIAVLQQYPELRIYINGHTCDIGTTATNERIGLQRAERAKAYLISQGIAENRILGIASKRDTEALVPNTNEENRLKNRRVEFIVDNK